MTAPGARLPGEHVPATERSDGMDLSTAEARVLALWLTARHLSNDQWLDWEDVPLLGEFAFDRLLEATEAVAARLSDEARKEALTHDIDPAFLHEEATDAR